MVFSSIIFLLYFLPFFLLGYQLMPRRLKNFFILLSSIFFYSWGAPTFIFILLASTIIDFYLVRKLFESQSQKAKKSYLTLSICLNVGLLLYFKYANFFIENVNVLLANFGWETVTWTAVILPIGISFYTFQTLTYSIDIYRGNQEPLKKLSDYLLYILSFPQMIAGPIVRFNLIREQILSRQETVHDKLQGFIRFSIGLAKKVLIANFMGEQADLIMNQSGGEMATLAAWIGILAYTFQIYFDFSGYSDMAIGLGRMMGFSFPENFNNPYISKNISEFWRRWHITLGQWMKDYLYIPLGGNRVDSKIRLYFNLWFVFLISGLWHGASWNFLIWGAFHGLFLILDRLFLIKVLSRLGNVFSVIFTFFIVVIGWVFFRIEDFGSALEFLSTLFQFTPINESFEVLPSFYLIFILAILFSFCTFFKIGKQIEQNIFYQPNPSLKWYFIMTAVALLLFAVSLSYIASSGFNPFIYFRF